MHRYKGIAQEKGKKNIFESEKERKKRKRKRKVKKIAENRLQTEIQQIKVREEQFMLSERTKTYCGSLITFNLLTQGIVLLVAAHLPNLKKIRCLL